MAIFSGSNSELKSNQTNSNTTIITAGAKIKGVLELTCNLYVDGEIEGEVNSQKEVNIGKNGHLKGAINAQRLVIQGYVEGTLSAQRVEIKAGGHVKGEIISSELMIESKGMFEGNSIVKDTPLNKKALSK